MPRYLLSALFLELLLVGPQAAAAQPFPAGAAIYERLRSQGLIEDYLTPQVSEIAGTLVSAAGIWPGYGVNRPYVEGNINIYLIDSRRLPDTNVFADLGVELAGFSFRDNALADEKTGIVFVDTVLLKSLITAAQLFSQGTLDTPGSVGAIRAKGIDAFRHVWDPSRNGTIHGSGYADQWVLPASGALAFILAHEMGHIAIGAGNVSKRRVPIKMGFADKQDEKVHWACSDLIKERYRQQQSIEKEADDFAVGLLGKVLFPQGVLRKPLLRYELGARWFLVYNMSEQMVAALYATESRNVLAGAQLLFGPEVFDALVSAKPTSGKGSVRVFFPKNHPAAIRRASQSLARLSASPYSLYHSAPPPTDAEIQSMEMLIAMECRNIRERRQH